MDSYFKKLERLAFALVRTRPWKEPTNSEHRRKNLWIQKSSGLAGPFALSLLVAIPYVAENSSGPIIVASLLLSAVDAAFTAYCYTDFETKHCPGDNFHCSGDLFFCLFHCVGELPAFLAGWWWIQAQAGGFAACARTLSSIMESVTGHHIEKLMESLLGAFTPLGAPINIFSVFVCLIPTVMCSLGMEESGFLRLALFGLTTLTSMTIFGSALATNQLFPTSVADVVPIIPDRNLYSKILSGASLASIGFLGLYSMCGPENLTLTQRQHFQVIKRFSLTGCVVSSVAFLFYFIESTVLNKVQQTFTLWDGDPPILWPLEGGLRLVVASLGIAALALATFEFLIPLSLTVTKMANDGLLYRNLRKEESPESLAKWNSITPLVFGGITAIQSLLIDTKVLLGLTASSLICMHITICSSMLALRYQSRSCLSHALKRSGHSRTRPRNSNGPSGPTPTHHHHTHSRRLTVSFLKNGLSKNPRDVTMDESMSGASGGHSDRTFLMGEPIRRESTSNFSMGSGVSGYESDNSDPDPCRSEGTDDTDIDAVVTEYHERIRVATLSGVMPMHPTPATGRRVAAATVALIPCCLALAASLNRAPRGHITGIMLAASSGLLTFLLLIVISRQPQQQRKRPARSSSGLVTGSNTSDHHHYDTATSRFFQYSIVPWLPAGAIFLHCCLLLEALDLAGPTYAFWLSVGLIIYFSYGVIKSVAAPALIIPDRLTSTSSPRPSVLSTVVCGNDPSTATTSTSSVCRVEIAEER